MEVAEWLHDPNVWRIVGAAAFTIYDRSGWQPQHYAIWTVVVLAGMELLARLAVGFGWVAGYSGKGEIKANLARLEAFESIDMLYIAINKAITAVFAYHITHWLWFSPLIRWAPSALSLSNTALALPLLFVCYDLPYTLFHRALHHRSVYALVHKHHHRQKVPFRGQLDAINVHPFEFVSGEYNHMAAAYAVAWAIDAATGGADGLHVGTVVAFIALGGFAAALNHTRYDIQLNLPWLAGVLPVFQVGLHDIHHNSFTVNYAQYVVLWDWLLGSYRSLEDGPMDKKKEL